MLYTFVTRAGARHTADSLLRPEDLPEGFAGNLARILYGDTTIFDADARRTEVPVEKARAKHLTIVDRNGAAAPAARSKLGGETVLASADVVESVKTTHVALTDAGFALPRTFYAVGTVLAASGVAAFEEKKRAYASLPSVTEGTAQLESQIKGESRKDVTIRVSDLHMKEDGTLTRGGKSVALTEAAFGKLSWALGMPSAAAYLGACWPELRATNVNAWSEGNPGRELVFRTRRGAVEGAPREVYAIVSKDYSACDADQIARIVREACQPWPDARVSAVYDADKGRVSFDVQWMSPIKPAHAVVGEVWRASARVTSDDTGGGAIKGGAGVSMALCLNFTYADAQGHSFSLRHVGRDARIVTRLRQEFRRSVDQINPLLAAWNLGCETDVIAQARNAAAAAGELLPERRIPARLWLLSGIVDRELVPVVGRKADAVKRLAHWHDADTSSAVRVHETSRASIVNAFTRYAHEEVRDPWTTDEIQRKASALLFSRRPLPVSDPSSL